MMNNMTSMNVKMAATQTVGAIMSQEPLMLAPKMRAREALVRLRQVGVPKDFMTNCYVVDEDYTLLGIITVRLHSSNTGQTPAGAGDEQACGRALSP